MASSMKRYEFHAEVQKEPLIPLLACNLANRDPAARKRARERLVAIGCPSVPALVPLLSYRKPHVRWEAAKALRDIADPITATALVNSMDDSDADVRWLAAEGVTALGREGLHALLVALIERAQSPALRDGAHHVLHVLVKRKGLGPILRPVLAVLEESEPTLGTPTAAYKALLKLREMS